MYLVRGLPVPARGAVVMVVPGLDASPPGSDLTWVTLSG
jgi:hypothetical protein